MYPNFDPSKMDPKLLAELSELVRNLPPDQIARMQTIMQKMMVGIDVRWEMQQLEKDLPPGFRERLMQMAGNSDFMAGFGGAGATAPDIEVESAEVEEEDDVSEVDTSNMDLRQARLTILRAVAEGEMSPEDAERLLFSESA